MSTLCKRSLIRQEWQAFWLAVSFLTRIPVWVKIDYSQRLMNSSSLYFPLVGLLLGALNLLVYSVLISLLPLTVTLLLLLVFHLWITGAFHEDGLADSLDAFGGGYTREKRLEIMKDSRIGTYGSVALFCVLALKWAAWVELDNLAIALLMAPAISRLTPLFLMHFMPYVTASEQSKTKPVADSMSLMRLALAILSVLLVALIAQVFWITLFAIAITLLCWGYSLHRNLGGYTGDTLGASVIISELLFLLLMLSGH